MEVIKLGKKGQVSIPAAILRQLGLEGGGYLIAEAGEDGAIMLRPAKVYPIEIYTDERIKELEEESRMTEAEREHLSKILRRS
jgi:AbrB family looped-hinge helix DNA binding protein